MATTCINIFTTDDESTKMVGFVVQAWGNRVWGQIIFVDKYFTCLTWRCRCQYIWWHLKLKLDLVMQPLENIRWFHIYRNMYPMLIRSLKKIDSIDLILFQSPIASLFWWKVVTPLPRKFYLSNLFVDFNLKMVKNIDL